MYLSITLSPDSFALGPRPAEHTILHDRWIIYDLQTKWPFKLSTQFAATSAVFFQAVIFLHLHVFVVIYEEDNEYFWDPMFIVNARL